MGMSAVRVRTNLFINPHFVFKTYFLKLSHISDVARKNKKYLILSPRNKTIVLFKIWQAYVSEK